MPRPQNLDKIEDLTARLADDTRLGRLESDLATMGVQVVDNTNPRDMETQVHFLTDGSRMIWHRESKLEELRKRVARGLPMFEPVPPRIPKYYGTRVTLTCAHCGRNYIWTKRTLSKVCSKCAPLYRGELAAQLARDIANGRNLRNGRVRTLQKDEAI